MKTVAIIQARMSSRRLPGKILETIGTEPLLAHVVRRAQASGVFDVVSIATSTDTSDDPVQQFCDSQNIPCFRGSLKDVLDRYERAAQSLHAEIITRLTGDCPLLDPAVIRQIVGAFDPRRYDYVSNTVERTYPKGLDTEVFSMHALNEAHKNARLPSEREHVTPYFYTHPEQWRIRQITQKTDRSLLRWTVDEPRDLAFVRAIVQHLGSGTYGQSEILALLKAHPDLQRMNEGIDPNEGYQRSLKEDEAFLQGENNRAVRNGGE